MTPSGGSGPERQGGARLPPRRRGRVRSVVLPLVTAGVLLAGAAKKVIDYAGEPTQEKDCLPAAPAGAGTPARPVAVPGPAPGDAGSPIALVRRGGTVNDASCLSRTAIFGIVRPRHADDVAAALAFARARGLPVTAAGARHSMGGQAFARNGLVLDMTALDGMAVDAERRVLRVESGATWHAVQGYLHPRGLAVKAMQSTDIFTVGGSIAVNAHGMDHRAGSIAATIRSFRLVGADGRVVTVGRDDPLFRLVVGGYGLFGIVLDAELDVTDNVLYARERTLVTPGDFPQLLADRLLPDERYGLVYGRLSTSPASLFEEMIVQAYRAEDRPRRPVPALAEVGQIALRRLVLNVARRGAWARRLKWLAEKHVEPYLDACAAPRHRAITEAEACLVSRNAVMHDSVRYVKNRLRHETDILQEYFVPRARFAPALVAMRRVLAAHDANLLNASVRVVHGDDTLLAYAREPAFAIVLYLSQGVGVMDDRRMEALTRDLVEVALGSGGTFFLPYRLHYTADQLRRAYPSIDAFFAEKRRHDPDGRFTNGFYESYAGGGSPA